MTIAEQESAERFRRRAFLNGNLDRHRTGAMRVRNLVLVRAGSSNRVDDRLGESFSSFVVGYSQGYRCNVRSLTQGLKDFPSEVNPLVRSRW